MIQIARAVEKVIHSFWTGWNRKYQYQSTIDKNAGYVHNKWQWECSKTDRQGTVLFDKK